MDFAPERASISGVGVADLADDELLPAAWHDESAAPRTPARTATDAGLLVEGDREDPPRVSTAEFLPQPESSEDDAGRLSAEELQELALAGNPTLRQAEALVQQAQGNWLQAGLYPNPVVSYDGAGNNGAFDQQGAYLSQSIVTARKLDLNRAVAGHDVQRARFESEAQLLRVVNEIRIRCIIVLGAQRQVAMAEQLREVAEEGVRASQKRFEAEEVSRADVLQAQLQLNQTEVLLRNARFRLTAAWQQLGNMLGWPDLPLQQLAGGLDQDPPELEMEPAWQQLWNASPELQAARSRASAAAVQVRRESAQVVPDVKVTGATWHDSLSPPSMMYGLNVGIALPVFDRNQGNISAAVGELRAAQAEVTRLELELSDRLAAAFQRYRSSRSQVRIYQETILPTAEENLALTIKGYEEGELDLIRVLTARRDLFEINVNYLAALIESHIAAVEIEGMLLTGGLNPVASRPTASNAAGQTTGAGN